MSTEQSLGHEAHCEAFSRPENQCSCFYPELENLRKASKESTDAITNLLNENYKTNVRVQELELILSKLGKSMLEDSRTIERLTNLLSRANTQMENIKQRHKAEKWLPINES